MPCEGLTALSLLTSKQSLKNLYLNNQYLFCSKPYVEMKMLGLIGNRHLIIEYSKFALRDCQQHIYQGYKKSFKQLCIKVASFNK